VLNDFAVAIRSLQKDKTIEQAMTVDCDVHQGNGTAAIFGGDHTVFTMSIHQENNYPYPKPPSSLDINLRDGVGDEEYLKELAQGLDRALAEFRPDLIFYLAGADPYRDDQLGGLKLSLEGLAKRDRLVFEKASGRNIPVAVTLAGGYARQLEDTIQIHSNTIRVAKEFAK
jgi:acetoin utilization deacetylase AcuC-like enzyme